MESEESSKRAYRTPDEIKNLIIEQLRLNGCLPASEISKNIGYSHITGTFRRCLSELMEEGSVDYLYPDNIRTKHQRICLKTGRR